MDEVKIQSDFINKIVEKALVKVLRKKYGCNISLGIKFLQVKYENGNAHIRLDAEADMAKDDLETVIAKCGL